MHPVMHTYTMSLLVYALTCLCKPSFRNQAKDAIDTVAKTHTEDDMSLDNERSFYA